MSIDYLTILRVFGNTLAIIGYYVLLYRSQVGGSAMKIVGFLCVFPYCALHGLWDVVFVLSFFGVLDASNIWRHLKKKR